MSKMLIWLVAIGEPLPLDSNNNRLHRAGLLATKLVEEGHKVIWWTSTLDHFSKHQIFHESRNQKISEHLELKLIHSVRYHKNISLRRVLNHLIISVKFWLLAKKNESPDVILGAYPAIELCYACVKLGKIMQIPTFIDARDMWPDIFVSLVQPKYGLVIKVLLLPYFLLAKIVFRDATGIIGITDGFVDWALSYAKRKRTNRDRVFPLAYPQANYSEYEMQKANKKWESLGITKKKFIITFIGAIAENKIDFDTVFEAAQKLYTKFGDELLFVFCGYGDDLDGLKEKCKCTKNIIFPGWINGPEIMSLLRITWLGIAPYKNRYDYLVSIPNKPIEYFSYGLPVISSLRGELKKLMEGYSVGLYYESADNLILNIKKFFVDKNLYELYANNSRELYLKKFDAEIIYKDYADFLTSKAGEYGKQN